VLHEISGEKKIKTNMKNEQRTAPHELAMVEHKYEK
jgi:hypothetical protein